MEDEWPVDGREENPAIRCTVFAILEGLDGVWFYVCLPYRGVFRNYPWLVHVDEMTAVEDFEPEPEAPVLSEVQSEMTEGQGPPSARPRKPVRATRSMP